MTRLPDYTTNTLSHTRSSLTLNISSWEGGLVPGRDGGTYTCSSSSTTLGPGVNSTTSFRSHPHNPAAFALAAFTAPAASVAAVLLLILLLHHLDHSHHNHT